MKKFFILLMTMAGLSTTINAQVTIDETNFPDPEFRAYLLAQNYGQDGIITAEEMARITRMELRNTNITDISGIQLFTSLSNLNCSQNPQLTVLSFTACPALKGFHCSENPQLATLTFSGCPAMEWFNCVDNPQLTTLDFSNCQSLVSFNCNDNPQLAILTFSGFPSMEYFNCYNNGGPISLEIVDFTLLRNFNCYNNTGLNTLSVSNCPALKGFNAYNNHLTSLNVSDCPLLNDVTCYNNQLSDQAMFNLVTGLPDRSETSAGRILAIDLTSSTEGNVCTTTTVIVARVINWPIQAITENGWVAYEGSEPTSLNEIDAAKMGNGIRNNLMGQPVGNDYKGIVIENGHKLIVR